MFWELGRKTARPSPTEIAQFLDAIPAHAKIAVIGASTKELVEAAIGQDMDVWVFDFSPKMCADLRAAVSNRCVQIQCLDITAAIPEDFISQFDYVFSDRLINRFIAAEAASAFTGQLALLRVGGELRISVKLGYYPMDERMIAEGRRMGQLHTFFDEATRTIDFTAAGDILDRCMLPHGDIPRDILLNWYRGRNKESRFEDADIRALAACARFGQHQLILLDVELFQDAGSTMMYRFKANVLGE
jgi:hypothetical protein